MRINIVDADSITFIVCHQKKDEEPLTLEKCKERTDQFLGSLFKVTESTHYILYLTVGQSFRVKHYPEYKANRKGRELPQFFSEIKEYLITKYKAQYYHELEADDLCLITRNYLKRKYPDAEIFISSPDKDMLNLEGTQYDYKHNVWKETPKEEDEWYFWTSMITGDTADNVKGIPKMGPKGAEELFEEHLGLGLPLIVLGEYIDRMGCNEGIEAFYSTYKALKVLESYYVFEIGIINPIEVLQELKTEG